MQSQRKKAGTEPDRRQQILKAAVSVFAERGFHRTRVSDIAKRAGVAYGLIYHYFDSKDDVLNSVFEENWAVFLKVIRDLAEDEERKPLDQLRAIGALLIDALEVAPNIIQVIIQEVSRSDRFVHPSKVHAFEEAFAVVRGMIERGQADGSLDASIDAQVAAYVFFGALETICTGYMIGQIECGTSEQAAAVKHSFEAIVLGGLEK